MCIRDSPLSVRPYGGIRERLCRIAHSKTKVALITGRSASQLKRLLKGWDFPFEIFGCHGAEEMTSDGRIIRAPLDPEVQKALRTAHWRALNVLPPYRVERKASSVAAHFRGISQRRARSTKGALQLLWAPLTTEGKLQITPFKMGLEIRLSNVSKADPVKRLIRPPDASAYLGDDKTDEDAFRALRGRGLGVLVNRTFRPTTAPVWLTPPGEVLLFLDLWIQAVS
ncbi:MAG: hypothetical protein N2378_18420, partial [Chloroflexaceae bacterium]|nr:hypothetical protein [Chloroflexaceae bacterium]